MNVRKAYKAARWEKALPACSVGIQADQLVEQKPAEVGHRQLLLTTVATVVVSQ